MRPHHVPNVCNESPSTVGQQWDPQTSMPMSEGAEPFRALSFPHVKAGVDLLEPQTAPPSGFHLSVKLSCIHQSENTA